MDETPKSYSKEDDEVEETTEKKEEKSKKVEEVPDTQKQVHSHHRTIIQDFMVFLLVLDFWKTDSSWAPFLSINFTYHSSSTSLHCRYNPMRY